MVEKIIFLYFWYSLPSLVDCIDCFVQCDHRSRDLTANEIDASCHLNVWFFTCLSNILTWYSVFNTMVLFVSSEKLHIIYKTNQAYINHQKYVIVALRLTLLNSMMVTHLMQIYLFINYWYFSPFSFMFISLMMISPVFLPSLKWYKTCFYRSM